MTITAKVRKRMIENGRLVHAIVQGESNATTILFRIEGETDLVAEDTLFLYLLYKRPNDQTVQLPILLDYTIEDGVILATFTPGAYFTADAGPVEISVIATSSAAELGGSGEVTNTLLWSSFPAWLLVAPSQLADSSTIIEENVFTQYLAELEAESDEAKAYASDAEEFAKGTRSDGETVPHASSGSGDNAKAYKNLAKDWAMKTGGPVEGVEMSAKVYAASSQNYATESQQWANKMDGKVLGTDYSAKYYAGEASDSATAAGLSADSAAASAGIVSDHATAIDAIYADLLNIDVVATDIQDDDSVIDAVAQNIANVNAVAGNESNINAVNSNKTNIDTVAGSISNVGTVAGNISNVNAVAGNTANINAVKTNESNINTVAGISSNVTTVAGIASDVTAVAGIASDVSAVEDIKTDVSAVASIDTDVSAVSAIKDDVSAVATIDDDVTTVATDISDVSAVASDITKVTAVADDLTNIDAVADDLTNIDNAEANALKAEGWANGTQNGTPVSSDSPYYENNAKYWADAVPDLKDALSATNKRVENLEEAHGSYHEVDVKSVYTIPTGKGSNWLIDGLRGVSRARNQLATNPQFAGDSTTGWETIRGSISASGGVATYTVTNAAAYMQCQARTSVSLVNGHQYLVCARLKSSSSVKFGFACNQLGGLIFSVASPTANAWYSGQVLVTATGTGSFYLGCGYDGSPSNNDTLAIADVIVTDLTVHFNGTIPSDADTISEIQTNYPWLLTPSDYGTSVVNTVYEGIRSVGVNLISGFQVGKDWALLDASTRACFRLDNPRYIGKAMVLSATWPSTVSTIRVVRVRDANVRPNSFVYEEPISIEIVGNVTMTQAIVDECKAQLELGSTATTYHPYFKRTFTFPSPISLKSAGSVAEEAFLNEDGEAWKTNPIGSVTITNDNLSDPTDNGNRAVFTVSIPSNIKYSDSSDTPNILMAGFVSTQNNITWSVGMVSASLVDLGKIYVIMPTGTTKASMLSQHGGESILYELATPDPDTPITVLTDNLISTEGGGTLEAVKTYPIDDSFTVGYLTL